MARTKQTVISYYDEICALLAENWTRALSGTDPSAIHQYRLTIKRLQALFRLLEFVSEGRLNSKETHRRFRKAFRAGGKVRDMQVLLQHLDQQKPEGKGKQAIRIRLAEEESKYTKKLLKKNEEIIPRAVSETREQISSLLQPITIGSFRSRSAAWLKNEMSLMENLLEKIDDPESFHRFRQHQKEFFYMIHFLEEHAGMTVQTTLPLDKIKETAFDIGQWHDLHNLTRFISELLKETNDLPAATAASIRQLREHLENSGKELFGRLKEDLNQEGAFEVKVSY